MSNPNFSRVVVGLTAVFALFLAACDTASPIDVPPVVIPAEMTATPAPAVTTRLSSTITPTTGSTIAATETPVPSSPTPSPTLPPTETPTPQPYIVQEGDTLTSIADKLGTTAAMIQRANEISNGNTIYVGQELVIPAGDAALTERGVLPNQILCPSPAEIAAIDSDGGTPLGLSAVCQIPIVSYQFGTGDTVLVLVGGIHGGYEWNTILLAYEILDHLQHNPEIIPASLSVVVIPNANPDGLYAVTQRMERFSIDDVNTDTVPGRFNGHSVDLNRNWDCAWTPNGVWRDSLVSGGTAPFSELENQRLRDFLLAAEPAAVLFYHSALGGVFASGCDQIDPASEQLATVYSQASGYPIYGAFQQYTITGDASDWLAGQGIPAITIELTTHESIDWRMNLAGLNALMSQLAP